MGNAPVPQWPDGRLPALSSDVARLPSAAACGGHTTARRPFPVVSRETPDEERMLAEYAVKKAKRPPRIKIKAKTAGKAVGLVTDHPDGKAEFVASMRSIGASDPDFYDAILVGLVNASLKDGDVDEQGLNFLVSLVKLERRRRVAMSGIVPAKIATSFTEGERAVLSVIGWQCRHGNACSLPIAAIGALAGVGRTTVKRTFRQARKLGLLHIRERRIPGRKSQTNVITIVSKEWIGWLRNEGAK